MTSSEPAIGALPAEGRSWPKRIGVLTSGGDAPGMNAAIRAVVRKAVNEGIQVRGIRRGFAGLIDGDMLPLNERSVADIIHRGGTMLGSARSERFQSSEGFAEACSCLVAESIDGLVTIGGDGTFRGALKLAEAGHVAVGVPGSIDNDIPGTEYSIGFDTAVDTALEAIERLRDTAAAHSRVFLVEVMGRDSGFIALAAGLAGGAEAVLIPEIPVDANQLDQLCRGILASFRRGKRHSVIVVAEGAASAIDLGRHVEKETGLETRVTVLGHVQRGGRPTGFDRALASQMGAAAVDAIINRQSGCMTAWRCGRVELIPLAEVVDRRKEIDLGLYKLAKVLAI
jgi:6-phosphofructokinase 1